MSLNAESSSLQTGHVSSSNVKQEQSSQKSDGQSGSRPRDGFNKVGRQSKVIKPKKENLLNKMKNVVLKMQPSKSKINAEKGPEPEPSSESDQESDGDSAPNGFDHGPHAPELSGLPQFLIDSRALGLKTFQWLIHPYSVETFFNEIWEKKPLLCKRKNESYYKGLFSCKEFDKILKNNTILYNKNLDITSYENDERKTLNPDGRAYAAVVWDQYQQGNSVRFLNPQTYSKVRASE